MQSNSRTASSLVHHCTFQYLRLYSRMVDESARIGNEAGHGGTNVYERKEIGPNSDRRAEH
jgi:hypothetical protein